MTTKNFKVRNGIELSNTTVTAFSVNTTSIFISTGINITANGSTGTPGQVLASNGTSLYWSSLASGVGGANTQIQFNDSGFANGSSNFTFNKSTSTLKVTGVVDIASANTLNQTLTDAASIGWNTSSGQIATVTLTDGVGASRSFSAPTNLKVATYILHVIQGGTGSKTITWNSVFKWPAGVAPTLTTTSGARDVFSFVSDGTNLYGSFIPDVK